MTDFDKREFYIKWIDALRSGKYKQARGTLTKDYRTFCCLGVACEVSEVDRMAEEGTLGYENIFVGDDAVVPVHVNTSGFTSTTLPVQLTYALGWERSTGRFYVHVPGYSSPWDFDLSILNDDGFTFDQIADIIEYFFMDEGSK